MQLKRDDVDGESVSPRALVSWCGLLWRMWLTLLDMFVRMLSLGRARAIEAKRPGRVHWDGAIRGLEIGKERIEI